MPKLVWSTLVWFRMYVKKEHDPLQAEARCNKHAPPQKKQTTGKPIVDGLWRKVEKIHPDYRCSLCRKGT